MKLALKLVVGVLAAAVLYLGVTFVQVWLAAHNDQARPAEAIVVFGTAQYNGVPSPVLAARLDHAIAETVKPVTGTLLAAPVLAGAVNIKVDAVTNLAPLDFVRLGYAGHYETRALTAVGTAGPAGTGLTFAIPLTRDHALDEWAVKVSALGMTTIKVVDATTALAELTEHLGFALDVPTDGVRA